MEAQDFQDNLKTRLTAEELLYNMIIFIDTRHDSIAVALAAVIYFLGMNQDC